MIFSFGLFTGTCSFWEVGAGAAAQAASQMASKIIPKSTLLGCRILNIFHFSLSQILRARGIIHYRVVKHKL